MVLPHTSTISVNYSLKISLKAQGILNDIDLTVPITIGTIPKSDGQGTQLTTITYPNPIDNTNICDDNE